MPSASSGRIVKTSKGKKGTAHQKNHRWESFTTKVAKLNSLDPLRRVRRQDLDAEDFTTSTSYFKSGLERWQELNVTDSFVEFSHDVMPLSDSLPQILHYEDKIMDLLVARLESNDKETMEPMLQLLTEFAHDLGTRFEKHYPRALKAVVSIAGASNGVDVIEWSFSCLAFMFKYLSKLLVADLRATYDVMAPLLGKERHPPHIARFAAEAMSFLIKKAGAPGMREKSLKIIVAHTKKDLLSIRETRDFVLYYHGIMTMYAEAAKGNGLAVHSTGPFIFQSLLDVFNEDDHMEAGEIFWQDVICGILTSLVHHTSSDTLVDVNDAVLAYATKAVDNFSQDSTLGKYRFVLLSARMIGVVAGVRKGSRVHDWQRFISGILAILASISKSRKLADEISQDSETWTSVILSASIILQYSPMDALIPHISNLLDTLVKDPLANWFLSFSSYIAGVDAERFRSIVLPYFQRFVVAHWSDADNRDALCVLVPKLIDSGAIISSQGGKDGFTLPQSWQDQIVSKFEKLEISPFPERASPGNYIDGERIWHDRCLPKYHALLALLECSAVHPSTNAKIADILLRKIKLALRPSSALALEEAHFIVGQGFSTYIRMIRGTGQTEVSLQPLLRAAAPRYCHLPNFLRAMLSYETSLSGLRKAKGFSIDDDDLLIYSLVDNLSTDSHELRLLSLQFLDLFIRSTNPSMSEVLATMLLVENTPLDLQTARAASMHIRKLAAVYPNHSSDKLLSKAIPNFCFGMLTVKYAQIWDDATAALALIAETKVGEVIVAEISFRWLEVPSKIWDGASRNIEHEKAAGLTDFECSNLMRLCQVAVDVESANKEAQTIMLKSFEDEQKLVEERPSSARAQALRVLSVIPQLAEKKSRQLIPMFLSWARHEGMTGEEDSKEMPDGESDWTRKDQKGLLELLAMFGNPKVLFRATEVYSALLFLLENGDLEIQKAALNAVCRWKSPSIRPYEENLRNLLDEARFKEEVGLLFQGQTMIQPDHRVELMPVLLRLLYGRTIARKGAASGKQGMEARRLTVLRSLTVEDTGAFLGIALGPLNGVDVSIVVPSATDIFNTELINVRKQVGFMHMMETILKELGTNVNHFTPILLSATLYCMIFASRKLDLATTKDKVEVEDGIATQNSMLRVIRQTGFRCLILLFTNDAGFGWSSYLPIIRDELVGPRLDQLPIETAQGVSGVLKLLATWASSPKTVLLLGSDGRIITKLAECLVPAKSQEAVKLFTLNIFKRILEIARNDNLESQDTADLVKSSLLMPNMDTVLNHIGGVLRSPNVSKDMLEACVSTVSELAPLVDGSLQAHNLVEISVFLLDQPSRRVSPKIKSGLLLVLERFVPLYDLQDDVDLKDKIYNTITSLFGFFKDKISREVLSRVLLVYSRSNPILGDVALLCASLNSFKDGRLDEPDYDRRLQAFSAISQPREEAFNAYQWRPLVFNMLFYIKHDEEFGILSSNSSDSLCKFLDTAVNVLDPDQKAKVMNIVSEILLPSIYTGVREPSEIIRREYCKVMAHLVRTFHEWEAVSDMVDLLSGEDELESSFFNNVLATGKGRQSSAFGQLTVLAEKGKLSSRNVSQFFIPLIEHFIFDRDEGNDAHNLAAEATTTVGILARCLEWSQYRALLRRFTGYVTAKPELEKQIIRLLGKVIDALALSVSERIVPSEDDVAMEELQSLEPPFQTPLSKSLPTETKFANDLTSNVLPPLTNYLHDKDESTVSLRVPVAVIIVRLLKLLPQEQLDERLPPVLTDICHILRSKSQESRDMTRDTLVKVCVLLGPSCFGFVLKELRGALARGYQLHVLSYTMHSILVDTTPHYQPGDLDYCLPSIVAIIMDDIFGATGQEKDAEEYVSKMKEVKSSKSHDSMELVAKTATLSRLTSLVHPIQVLLQEKLNIRMVRKIDELLNRISTGLLRNSAVQSRDSLVFCYEIIQDVYKSNKPQAKGKEDYRLKKYLVQKGAKKSGSRSSTTVYTFKLVRFAMDVLRSVVKKYDELRTPANLAGFVPIIGDALVQAEEEVKVAAFRLLTTIIKVPLKAVDNGSNLYKVAALEATRGITGSSSTTSDISQAALKLISVILRERRDIQIKDSSVDQLLERLKDDMTDPERRHVTFNFLRAVLDSKVESAAVYDILDYVGTVMVTNDDKDTRDLARGAYFQFLREYPQMKKRWTKQLNFIVANLKYDREGGRLSILEVIHLLLSKSSHDFIQQVSATCFVPLIFVLVNDESEKCRMAAGEVIKEIFRRSDRERMQTFTALLHSWIEQSGNPAVLRLAFQTYGFYYEAQAAKNDDDLELCQASIVAVLESAHDRDDDWELLYAALQLASNLCEAFPEKMIASGTEDMWEAIRLCLSYPHAWVKLSASKLIGILFTDFARTSADGLSLPLQGSNGLELDTDDARDSIKRIAGAFKTPGLTEALAAEIVKTLSFLGRCADASHLEWKASGDAPSDEEQEQDEAEDELKQSALQYMFGRLSFILRRETSPPRAPMLIPKTAALQLMQVLSLKISEKTLLSLLPTILLPLHNITDPSIPIPYSTDDVFKADYETLRSESQELMALLQRRCGAATYTAELLKVRNEVKARRNQRSTKRKIEAVSAPEKYGKDKQKKQERKKERRKEKGLEHRDQRRGY